MKKRKRKSTKKEPGLIVTFDDKDYTPGETAFLWTRLFQVLTQLENESLQTA